MTFNAIFAVDQDVRSLIRDALSETWDLIANPSLLMSLVSEHTLDSWNKRINYALCLEMKNYIDPLTTSLEQSKVDVDAKHLIYSIGRMTMASDGMARCLRVIELLQESVKIVGEFEDYLRPLLVSVMFPDEIFDSTLQRMIAMKAEMEGVKLQANVVKTQAQAYIQTVIYSLLD